MLTDLQEAVQCKVLPKLADHSLVLASVLLEVPKEVRVEREKWLFEKASWIAFKAELATTDWNRVFFNTADDPKLTNCTAELADLAAKSFTDFLLTTARKHVPVKA